MNTTEISTTEGLYRRHCFFSRALLVLTVALTGALPVVAEWQQLGIDFYPNGDETQGHPIRMVFEADVQREGRPLEAPAAQPAAATAERFLADYIAVLRDGTVAAMLPFWVDSERAETERLVAPVFDQQKALFASVKQSRLFTKVRYGRYLLAAVRHERVDGAKPLVMMYPLIETAEGYALSNALHQDSMFQILYFSFQDGVGLDSSFKTIN